MYISDFARRYIEGPTTIFSKEEIYLRNLIYVSNNVVHFRGSLMAAAGALITTKYGPISPPGERRIVSRFPAGRHIVGEGPPSPAFLSLIGASVLPRIGGIMGAAVKVALGIET